MGKSRRQITKEVGLALSAVGVSELLKKPVEKIIENNRPERRMDEILLRYHDFYGPGQELPDRVETLLPDNYQEKLQTDSDLVKDWAEEFHIEDKTGQGEVKGQVLTLQDEGKLEELKYEREDLFPPEEWKSTEEFLRSKTGDCEEFANAMYCMFPYQIEREILDSKIVIGRWGTEQPDTFCHTFAEFTVEDNQGQPQNYIAGELFGGNTILGVEEAFSHSWTPMFEYDEDTPMRTYTETLE